MYRIGLSGLLFYKWGSRAPGGLGKSPTVFKRGWLDRIKKWVDFWAIKWEKETKAHDSATPPCIHSPDKWQTALLWALTDARSPTPTPPPPHTSWWADVESKQTSRQRRKLQNSAKSWVEKLSKEGVGDSKPSSRQGRGSREDNGHETWKEVKAAGGCALLGLWESMWVHREQLRKEMSFEGKKLSRQGHSERAHIPSSVLNQGRKSHSNPVKNI